MRFLLRATSCAALLLSLFAISTSCGAPGTNGGPQDAGTAASDSGTTADSGTAADAGTGTDAGTGEDAGVTEDAGLGADAGGEDAGGEGDAGADAGTNVDGGTADDGGTDGGATCGANVPILYQVVDEGIGFAPTIPSCYKSPADCDVFFTERFTDQSTLETFYQNELQAPAPIVNFNLADVLVTYSCSCPSFGFTLDTKGVSADACTATMYADFNKPGEGCFTQQTFTRPYSTVTIIKDAGITENAVITPVVYSCE